MTNLLAIADRGEDVSVFFVLPLLPYTLSSLSPELLQTFLEFFVLLLPLLLNSAIPLRIECFGRSPFLPGELFDLISKEEHHVGISRLVRIGF
jgi:hypothetical protein